MNYQDPTPSDYISQAKFEERERICKILEKYALRKCDPECSYRCECFGKFEAMRFIELIRETAGLDEK